MKKAFTLVEILIVVSLFMLILLPTLRILSYGGKSAIEGVQRNAVVMSGQQIIAQLRADLAMSNFVINDGEVHDIHSIMTEQTSGDSIIYSFLSFNESDYQSKVTPTLTGNSPRLLNRVEYHLVTQSNSPFKTLERVVTINQQISTTNRRIRQTLSENVNFFAITPETVSSNDYHKSFFRISLQLFDRDETRDRGHDADPDALFIADFLGTVNPVILNRVLDNKGLNRNWYTDAES